MRDGIPVPQKLEPFRLEPDIRNQISEAEKQLRHEQHTLSRIEKAISQDLKTKEKISDSLDAVYTQIRDCDCRIAVCQNQLRQYANMQEEWKKAAVKVCSEQEMRDHFWQTEWLSERLEKEAEICAGQIKELDEQCLQLKDRLRKLRASAADIEPEVERVLSECGIRPLSVSSYLRENISASFAQKEQIARQYPLAPFSLLMSKAERENFIASLEQQEVVVSAPVIITDTEQLSKMSRQQIQQCADSCYTIYARFNTLFLDPEKQGRLISEIQSQIDAAAGNRNSLEAVRDEYKLDLARLADQNKAGPADEQKTVTFFVYNI